MKGKKYKNKNINLIEGNQNMYESLESPPNEKQIKRLVQEYRGLVDKYEMNYEQFVYEKMNTESNISELLPTIQLT